MSSEDLNRAIPDELFQRVSAKPERALPDALFGPATEPAPADDAEDTDGDIRKAV
ncbi:hypothetical protein [Nocardia sp. NPDC019395]|uniref:hypothetical protein n=1 Tax=Nocardia sp. NPDC019395 TaxID=3154686 RepID=UPI0033E5DE82